MVRCWYGRPRPPSLGPVWPPLPRGCFDMDLLGPKDVETKADHDFACQRHGPIHGWRKSLAGTPLFAAFLFTISATRLNKEIKNDDPVHCTSCDRASLARKSRDPGWATGDTRAVTPVCSTDHQAIDRSLLIQMSEEGIFVALVTDCLRELLKVDVEVLSKDFMILAPVLL